MKSEKQVTNLQLSKKLKELGVKQESLFYWNSNNRFDGGFDLDYLISTKHLKNPVYSAFTVAELGEMLPHMDNRFYYENNNGKNWVVKNSYITIWEDTEANARAKMLIYLIENKLIKPVKKEKGGK